MLEPHADPAAADRRAARAAAAAVVLLVCLRSAVFVLWEQAQFDSDQAITGLMAKHLAEGRAFPLFYYGQSYMLAVEAWLAAPLFLLAGPSVTALKLPLLAINVAIGLLLLRLLQREAGLRPWTAVFATLPFVMAPPGTAARLLDANGGNVEPALYVVLLWLTRMRPAWGGLILGLGFLQREFTIYGLLALLMVEAADRSLFTREGALRRLRMLRVAAEVWLVVQWLRQYSSAAGPGTSLANIFQPRDNILELARRTCVDAGAAAAGAGRLVTEHWPVLFGTRVLPLTDFGIESRHAQGAPWSGLLLVVLAGVALAAIAARLVRDRGWRRDSGVCTYLTLAGALSAAGYVAGRCGEVGFGTMRYDLLSVIGAVGIAAWFLQSVPAGAVRRLWLGALTAWVLVTGAAHAALLSEYVRRPPVGGKQMIVRTLEARGIQYATADYWIAYAVTFLTGERTIVHATDVMRIPAYRDEVERHRSEAVRISRTPCDPARPRAPGIYLCP